MKRTNRCFDKRPLLAGTAFLPLKIVSKTKNRKKESHSNKADKRKNQKETE